MIKADVGDTSSDVVDMEEELQNEVGALWDMTSNVVCAEFCGRLLYEYYMIRL